jgi:hypothetical protein
MRDDTESPVAVVHLEDNTPGRLSRLEAENQALRGMLSLVEERLEFLEDSLDAQLARSEHQNSGGASYGIKDIAAKLGL